MVESRNHYFFVKTSPDGGQVQDVTFVIKKVVMHSRDVGDPDQLPGVFNLQEKEVLEALARRFPLGKEPFIPKRYGRKK